MKSCTKIPQANGATVTTALATANSFKSFFSGLLLTTSVLFANSVKAQTIIVDGNPSDWPAALAVTGNPFKAHILDTVNNCTDNVWESGNKVNDAVSAWTWTNGNTNDKTDMRNTGVALVGHKLYMFADLYSANGDASIGFWIFRGGAAPVAGGTFTGVHTDGDLLISMFFTNGHSTATPAVYKWIAGSLVPVTLGSGATKCATNASTLSVPSGWTYSPKSGTAGTYPSTSFFEGYVDLDSTGTTFITCFNSYIAFTWQSQSLSASMADLVFGQLPVLPNVSVDNRTACSGGSATFTAVATNGTSPYQYSWNGGTYATANTLTISPVTSAANEIVTVKDANGCVASDTAKLTITASPTAGAISGTATLCAGTTATLTHGTSSGDGAWSSSSTSVATVNAAGLVSGIAAGTATISFTVSSSCGSATSTKVVTINPAAAAGTFAGSERICAGSVATYTATVSGGVWSSSTTSVATVSTAGVVSGVAQGTARITYTVSNSCGSAYTTKGVTINPMPVAGAISGTATVCAGANVTLTNASSIGDGSWTSASTSTATVTSAGIVSGIAAGTATISFTATNSCGTANSTKVVTVNPLPTAGDINGVATVCAGSVTTLSDAVSGGVWSTTPGIATIATVNAAGTVTGVAQGTATISYSVTNSCGTTSALKTVTVNPLPVAGTISGTNTMCAGTSVTLTHSASTGEGAWSSSSPATATVTAAGIVSGIAAGTAAISFTATNSCGTATASSIVTVNPLPVSGSISGLPKVCATASTTFTNAATGGVWSSASPAIATIDALGVVTGVAAGSATISYTVTNGCGVSNATKSIFVNPLPVAGTVAGLAMVCAGSKTQLSNTVIGGVWSSNATDVATVGTAGDVLGIAAGSATISYTVTTFCGTATATKVVTVNPLPVADEIEGTATACEGSATTLTNTAIGGAWSSNATEVATVNAAGEVSGIAAGNATISYAVTNICGTATTTKEVTINPLPVAGTINGAATVCVAATTALSNDATGGVWNSNATDIATVDATGVVAGINAGNTTVSYTVTNSCGVATTSVNVTVNPLPVAEPISGTATVCEGATAVFDGPAAGGAWTTPAPGTASVTPSGMVTGYTAGVTTISYSVTNSCGTAIATRSITVNPLPAAFATIGTAATCAGTTVTLNNTPAGGTWNCGATGIASVNADGVVTGVAAGTATVSYTVSNSCGSAVATSAITINPLPVAGEIAGTANVCPGATTSLTNTVAGGVWSTDATTATVDAAGAVTGSAAGTATISYTVTNGCGAANATRIVTVNALPNAGTINGATAICAGATTTLTNAAGSGVWSSSNASASVNASGTVTAAAAGAATISYTVTNSCGAATATKVVTINPLPAAGTIAGVANACAGSSTTLTSTVAGGAWSSASGAATVNAAGTVTGMAAGTATISYTVTNSCGIANTTKVVTINALPNAGTINNVATICAGTTRTLTNTVAGGAWTSATPSVATISAAGVVTGVAGGLATISYTVSNGTCTSSAVNAMTINPLPYVSPICGSSRVRYNGDTTLIDSVAGGIWSSSNAYVTVTGGLVHGVHTGSATITYKLTNSCGTTYVTKVMTVDSPSVYVSAIAGPAFYTCQGSTAAYWSATTGGVFSMSSADAGVATTTPAGLVTGVSAGTATLSYTYLGATTTQVLTVYPIPAAITGSHVMCNGAQMPLFDATPGGVWTSGIPSTATIGAAEGIVTAANPGVVPMYYTLVAPAGCRVSFSVTVNPNPATIAGSSAVCVGAVINLSDITAGGTWSGSNDHASIDGSGHVTGISVGGVDLTYTLPTGCFSNRIFAINGSPSAINGTKTVCTGLVTFLSDATTPAMSWTSSTPTVATISATGGVTGVTAGTTTITFKLTTGCYTTTVVTVNALPTVTAILGASSVSRTGAPVTLSDLTAGGVWSSDHTSIISIGSATGIATAIASSGTATIKYLVTNSAGCSASVTKVLTATATGARHTSSTTTTTTTVGSAVALTASIAGGEWTTSDENVAMVDANGNVTTIAEGNVTITHTTTDEEGNVNTEITNVVINQLPIEANLAPNPNRGSFVVKGTTGTPYDATVSYQITNMAGQIMYRNSDFATGGVINQSFNLDSKFTTGTYVLIVTCGDQRKTFNFVVE